MGVGERIPHQANILFMGVEERESHIKQISCSGGWGRENPTSSKYPVHGGGGERESHIKQISCSCGWGRENPTSSKYPVHGGGGERIPHNFITGKYKIKGILQLY